jgi:hypothetical protein
MGRWGGAIALAGSFGLVGVGAFGVSLVDFSAYDAGAVAVVPFFLITVGLVVGGLGLRAVAFGDRVTLSPEALLRALERRPVTLCLDCRAVVQRPPCPHCGFSARCVTVRSEADAAAVQAELSKAEPVNVNETPVCCI